MRRLSASGTAASASSASTQKNQQVAAHWDRRAAHFDEDFGHSICTAAERAAWDRIPDLTLPAGDALENAGKKVQLLVAEHYNHFELPETLCNPYGLLGRAALDLMGLRAGVR